MLLNDSLGISSRRDGEGYCHDGQSEAKDEKSV